MGLSQIPRFLGIKTTTKVGKHTSYGVTTLGAKKAHEMEESGPRFRVLSHLSEEGPSSISELERECQLNNEKVMVILRSLMRDGLVQPATGA